MIQRYQANILKFAANPEYQPADWFAYAIALYTLDNFGYSLDNIQFVWSLLGWEDANKMLQHFLEGSAENVEISIIDDIFASEPDIKEMLFMSIRDKVKNWKFEDENCKGIFVIKQSDWKDTKHLIGKKIENNNNLAYGTMSIYWETNGQDIVFYINNPYSFNIVEYRVTNSLYMEAAYKVIALTASDFFIVGRLTQPLIWIYGNSSW